MAFGNLTNQYVPKTLEDEQIVVKRTELSKEKLFSKQREADKLGSRQNLFVSFLARWTLNDIFK